MESHTEKQRETKSLPPQVDQKNHWHYEWESMKECHISNKLVGVLKHPPYYTHEFFIT